MDKWHMVSQKISIGNMGKWHWISQEISKDNQIMKDNNFIDKEKQCYVNV